MEYMIFKPAHDITAYELARILQKVSSLTCDQPSPEAVSTWPRELQRHWRPAK